MPAELIITHIFIQYFTNVKSHVDVISRVEQTTISSGKVLFSLNLLSGHFCGQTFIKTVRGRLYLYGCSEGERTRFSLQTKQSEPSLLKVCSFNLVSVSLIIA